MYWFYLGVVLLVHSTLYCNVLVCLCFQYLSIVFTAIVSFLAAKFILGLLNYVSLDI
jgi:hypothetical protein